MDQGGPPTRPIPLSRLDIQECSFGTLGPLVELLSLFHKLGALKFVNRTQSQYPLQPTPDTGLIQGSRRALEVASLSFAFSNLVDLPLDSLVPAITDLIDLGAIRELHLSNTKIVHYTPVTKILPSIGPNLIRLTIDLEESRSFASIHSRMFRFVSTFNPTFCLKRPLLGLPNVVNSFPTCSFERLEYLELQLNMQCHSRAYIPSIQSRWDEINKILSCINASNFRDLKIKLGVRGTSFLPRSCRRDAGSYGRDGPHPSRFFCLTQSGIFLGGSTSFGPDKLCPHEESRNRS